MKAVLPEINREPDEVYLSTEPGFKRSKASKTLSNGEIWEGEGVRISFLKKNNSKTSVFLESPQKPLNRVWFKWKHAFKSGTLLLGDTWERTYGDQEWRGFTLSRPMAWYFLATLKGKTAGYGVETGCASIATWHADGDSVILQLDVRCGGEGVQLGSRVLEAATIVCREPQNEESPFQAAHALCKELCSNPKLPKEPVVGHNDWYWLYGKNSEELILDATQRLLDLYPQTSVRPWSVIDDGWQESGTGALAACNGGPWNRTNPTFPDMASLASKIKSLGARPGIWMRPLLTKASGLEKLSIRCPRSNPNEGGITLDPSIPEVLDIVKADISCIRQWGYELIKHDFSTFDVTGRWGFQMNGAQDGFTFDGWSYADRSRTSAEIILSLYRAIREAAGEEVIVLGCNTVSHLSAGLFEVMRTGDDTSASDWDRTRRMGINTLAFRAHQQGAFYAVDADCVPISPKIPWKLTQEWLDLVARSGTPLFLSMDTKACGAKEKEGIRAALAAAVKESPVGEPIDWLKTPYPRQWRLAGDAEGAMTKYRF